MTVTLIRSEEEPMSVYDYIPKDRWITREELVSNTGLSDRKIRDEINALRKKPETVIVSSSHGKGYKRPASVEELRICLNESKSRVKEEEMKQRVLEQAIRNMQTESDTGQYLFDFN